MAEILETLGINGQLGKALLYELLGQIAKDNSASSSITDQSSPLCKSVPISPSDAIPSVEIISVDCRNHGQSPRNNLMTYPLMAGDIAETLKHLNISRAVLIGHSIGGKVAMELALSMPDSVEKLIVEDLPPMVVPAPLVAGILSAMLNLDFTQVKNSNDADDMLRESIPHDVIRAYVLTTLHDDEEGKFHWLADIKNLLGNLKSLVDGNESGIELKGRTPYTGETLFIAGGESQDLKNADMNEIRKIFPKADREVIPGASHFVHTDKPQEFLEIVHKFLR